MKVYPQRRAAGCVVLFLAVLMSAPGNLAVAQFRVAHEPDGLHTSQRINLFVDVDGSQRYDGALLAIPSSWQLENAALLGSNGRSQGIPFRPMEATNGRYLLVPNRRITDQDRLILQILTGEMVGSFGIRLTPVVANASIVGNAVDYLDGQSTRSTFHVDDGRKSPGNRVLQVHADATVPFLLSENELTGESDFTAELWIKTTSRNAILLSTWDGNEKSSYPLELLLDEGGHAVFFRGMPGKHRSLRSEMPVADGSWHHVAVTRDGSTKWSRMLIDGAPSDSIFQLSPLHITGAKAIYVGGRSPSNESDKARSGVLSGQLDEIRIWNEARDPRLVRLDMRRPLQARDGLSVLSFEEADLERFVSASAGISPDIIDSDLSFYQPVQNLQVSLDVASVLLQWQANDPSTIAFEVERSSDGLAFDLISRIERSDRDRFNLREGSFNFRDTSVPLGVTFYRIRQVFPDGMETVSRALKVGMGVEEEAGAASLTGNFPNPFNPSTTVTYLLSSRQYVQLSVWDLAGQMVEILVDESQDAGDYSVQFDAKDLPSGTYFVRMRTSEGIRSHQITLMK